MDLKNVKEQLTAQEVELLNDFQMEELEERMEMKSWAEQADPKPAPEQTPGTAQVGVSW